MHPNPTPIRYTIHPSAGVLRPKPRWKAPELTIGAKQIALPAVHRMPRMKRSGRPHPQIWARPATAIDNTPVKLPAASSLDEVMSCVTEASLSPAHVSAVPHWNREVRETLKTKALEIFYRCEPEVLVTVKRIRASTFALKEWTAALWTRHSGNAVKLFDRYQPEVWSTLKRIRGSVPTFTAVAAFLRAHHPAKPAH